MLRFDIGAPCGLRWGLLGLAAIVGFVGVASDPADARSRRRKAHSTYSPPYAAIVMDANSGKVLHASHPDARRHPASLTKIMTLYLLFEQLEAGRIKLDSPLRVSEHAANQPPTKLGLKDGSTIRVEDAIKSMVTRSANDVAAVVAENLGGSERAFAKMMTRKAHSLGMTRTVYRNASGLPDSAQVTTARDQAILGRAIQEHFPLYYKYFTTRSFKYRGQRIANHNRLLGRVEGVDGIKTGYTRASGFNLVTSVHRDRRYLVAVVLGGRSGSARDARMRQLITSYIRRGATKRTAPTIARARQPTNAKAGYALASADSAPPKSVAPRRRSPPSAGSHDPIRPVSVRTLAVRPGKSTRTAAVGPLHLPSAAYAPESRATASIQVQGIAPTGARAGALAAVAARASTAKADPPSPPSAPAKRQSARSGWLIQVGAYPDENEAKEQLTSVKHKASRLLASADSFTESVQKGSRTLYRARFAGLDKEQAQAACRFLKRNDIDCLAIKN